LKNNFRLIKKTVQSALEGGKGIANVKNVTVTKRQRFLLWKNAGKSEISMFKKNKITIFDPGHTFGFIKPVAFDLDFTSYTTVYTVHYSIALPVTVLVKNFLAKENFRCLMITTVFKLSDYRYPIVYRHHLLKCSLNDKIIDMFVMFTYWNRLNITEN